jgi:hypothetical protein
MPTTVERRWQGTHLQLMDRGNAFWRSLQYIRMLDILGSFEALQIPNVRFG